MPDRAPVRASRRVACVTGLLATGAIENEVQLYLDKRGAHALLREGRVFDLTENRDDSPLYPYSPACSARALISR